MRNYAQAGTTLRKNNSMHLNNSTLVMQSVVPYPSGWTKSSSYMTKCLLLTSFTCLSLGHPIWTTLALKIQFSVEFSFNPNKIHQNKLIKIFRITRPTLT